jgi:ABC-2 type transport system ATP-binding protein
VATPAPAIPDRDASAGSLVALRARGLTKRFGPVTAIDGLELEVRYGELFGLIGPDGAGKSTTIRMLCGVLAPTSGEVQVAGYDVLRQAEQVRRSVGYIAQRFSLYADLTVEENLRFFGRVFGVPDVALRARIDELLELMRLDEFRRRLAAYLSGGMRQKLALACALVHQPPVLLLDEPTAGIDPVSRRDLWRMLYRLQRQGTAILLSSAYMDEAERCDRLALLSAGRVVAQGTPDELRGRMPYRVLEIVAAPLHEAHRVLRSLPSGGVQLLGDRLHVLSGEPPEDDRQFVEALRASGIEVRGMREVMPSMEDVFLALQRPAPARPVQRGETGSEIP